MTKHSMKSPKYPKNVPSPKKTQTNNRRANCSTTNGRRIRRNTERTMKRHTKIERERGKVLHAPHDQFMNAFLDSVFSTFFSLLFVRFSFLHTIYIRDVVCILGSLWVWKRRCFLNDSSRNVECNAVAAVFVVVVVFACVIIVSNISLVSLQLRRFPFHSSNFCFALSTHLECGISCVSTLHAH